MVSCGCRIVRPACVCLRACSSSPVLRVAVLLVCFLAVVRFKLCALQWTLNERRTKPR